MTDNERLAAETVGALREKGLKIAFAESCTGGMLAESLTSVSGCSNVLEMSVVTYSNRAKELLLGVSRSTLEKYSAVSGQCAVEMAQGLLRLSGADIAVSVTGVAGPSGGTEAAPVGTVFIGFARAGAAEAKRFSFCEHNRLTRGGVRRASVREALIGALKLIGSF